MMDNNIQPYSSKAETLDAIFRSNIQKYAELLKTLKGLDARGISISPDKSDHISKTSAEV